MGAGTARLLTVATLALPAAVAAAQEAPPAPGPAPQEQLRRQPPGRAPIELRTLRDLALALEVCWRASMPARVVPGMTVKILVAFTRTGEMFGEPKFTFVTPGVPTETVAVYQRAAADALARCNPLPFSAALGNAIAGRPCIFQFIDRRNEKRT
jgi:hypothetical protein